MSHRDPPSRERAQETLLRQDWPAAWDYWTHLWETEGPALEWLEAMEAAALPRAAAGSLAAQQTLGSTGSVRYTCGFPSEIAPLRHSLMWIVAALRQELSATGLQMLVEGYRSLRAQGVRDTGIEAFLSEPTPRAAWQKWGGMDPLSE